jgi:glutamine synthetase
LRGWARSARSVLERWALSDIDGILRGKYLRRDKFASVVNDGLGFCNVVFGWDSSDQLYDNTQ